MNADMGSTTGPRAKCDQVIFEALSKATEIIVASRGGGSDARGASSNMGMTSGPSSSSSRFNLTLPENHTLRNILQRWRRALHLPIRLDVYFEHDNNKRELLERWCLGYVIGGDAFWRDPNNNTNAALLNQHADPIVQLRHVCKKIVIWLRTLYCFARLMPSTAFLSAKSQLGFSLYAVSEDADDVTQLKEQGFLHQIQPSSNLTTPYGELSWQVLYAARDSVERLLPRTVNASLLPQNSPARTNPIAIASTNQARADHFESRGHQRNALPQSAPAHLHNYMQEANNAGDPLSRPDLPPQPQQNTYNPSFFTGRDRRDSSQSARHLEMQHPLPTHALLQRRHTSIGQETEEDHPSREPPIQDKPQRVRSGLSLALMMSDNQKADNPDPDRGDPGGVHKDTFSNEAAAEKRRAALHQMPPHLMAPSASREYGFGYAYNHHIPKLQSDANAGAAPTETTTTRDLPPGSPLFGTTPPSGAFLAGAMATDSLATRSPLLKASFGTLLPPRNSTPGSNKVPGSATPPFATRPNGFMQDHHPPQYNTSHLQPSKHQETHQELDMPPLTSLDMLHHSPFQAGPAHGGSMLSSLSAGGAPAVFGSEAASLFYNSAGVGSDLMRKSSPVFGGFVGSSSAAEEYEEMPFAVDHSPPRDQTSSSQLLASSAAVASFAQKCSTHHRLDLFDQQQQQRLISIGTSSATDAGDNVGELTSQLADFRSFGESLRLGSASGSAAEGDTGASASSSTPISLRH